MCTLKVSKWWGSSAGYLNSKENKRPITKKARLQCVKEMYAELFILVELGLTGPYFR